MRKVLPTMTRTTLLSLSACAALLCVGATSAHGESLYTNESAAVRSEPKKKSRVKKRIGSGKKVRVIARKGRWVKVRSGKVTGWVPKSSVASKKKRAKQERWSDVEEDSWSDVDDSESWSDDEDLDADDGWADDDDDSWNDEDADEVAFLDDEEPRGRRGGNAHKGHDMGHHHGGGSGFNVRASANALVGFSPDSSGMTNLLVIGGVASKRLGSWNVGVSGDFQRMGMAHEMNMMGTKMHIPMALQRADLTGVGTTNIGKEYMVTARLGYRMETLTVGAMPGMGEEDGPKAPMDPSVSSGPLAGVRVMRHGKPRNWMAGLAVDLSYKQMSFDGGFHLGQDYMLMGSIDAISIIRGVAMIGVMRDGSGKQMRMASLGASINY